MPEVHPVLVTGAGGNIGGRVVSRLAAEGVQVRALVLNEDDRAKELRAKPGVEVVAGDLTRAPDVVAALDGCRRLYFGMSVSPSYLEAAATVAVTARDNGPVEMLVNMSQLTVSQMSLRSSTESRQQRMHWLAEYVLDWSGLPVTHVRPTVFMENPLFSMAAVASVQRDATIRLPFGNARTSPVAARDVAEVVARTNYVTSESQMTYSAGVQLSGLGYGINLSSQDGYDASSELIYKMGSQGHPLCGEDDWPGGTTGYIGMVGVH
jgi:NAD(P)H dehydrogenase (quinone)